MHRNDDEAVLVDDGGKTKPPHPPSYDLSSTMGQLLKEVGEIMSPTGEAANVARPHPYGASSCCCYLDSFVMNSCLLLCHTDY